MPVIPSPTSFKVLEEPSTDHGYVHPMERRSGRIPMAFQVTSPLDFRRCLLPHALILHVNPASFGENLVKKVEVLDTLGGYVEQHWFDDLSDVSADGSTGAFLNLYTGLSSVMRRDTIAWSRYRDLYDLFNNNGSVYDESGKVVLQGKIMLLYDRGTYLGHFTTFDMEETAETPFAFKLSWGFKIEHTLLKIPSSIASSGLPSNPTTTPRSQSTTTPSAVPPQPLPPLPRPSPAENAIREEQNRQLIQDFKNNPRPPSGNLALKKPR